MYLTARKYTNFPDLPMRRHIIQSDFIYASIKEFERCLGGDCGLSKEVRTNSSEVSFDSSEVSFRLHVEDFHFSTWESSFPTAEVIRPNGEGRCLARGFVSGTYYWVGLRGRFLGKEV